MLVHQPQSPYSPAALAALPIILRILARQRAKSLAQLVAVKARVRDTRQPLKRSGRDLLAT
jgi:hypothetical protein